MRRKALGPVPSRRKTKDSGAADKAAIQSVRLAPASFSFHLWHWLTDLLFRDFIPHYERIYAPSAFFLIEEFWWKYNKFRTRREALFSISPPHGLRVYIIGIFKAWAMPFI
jgi:hypothetical protein